MLARAVHLAQLRPCEWTWSVDHLGSALACTVLQTKCFWWLVALAAVAAQQSDRYSACTLYLSSGLVGLGLAGCLSFVW